MFVSVCFYPSQTKRKINNRWNERGREKKMRREDKKRHRRQEYQYCTVLIEMVFFCPSCSFSSDGCRRNNLRCLYSLLSSRINVISTILLLIEEKSSLCNDIPRQDGVECLHTFARLLLGYTYDTSRTMLRSHGGGYTNYL